MPLSLCILGASGKVGKRVVALAAQDPAFHVATEISRFNSSSAPQAIAQADITIDFSSAEAIFSHLQAALIAQKPLVIGTTGHTSEGKKAIAEASHKIPILFSPNFSFGTALCLKAATQFSQILQGKGGVEIIETHHIHKKDSPSGTALALAQAIDPLKAIPIQSIRSGEVLGEHILLFHLEHEKIELKHTILSRDVYASGALEAARYLYTCSPGLYTIEDIKTFEEQRKE